MTVDESPMIRTRCTKCLGVYYVTAALIEQRREDGKCWWCPYCGQEWKYKRSKIDILTDQLKTAESDRDRYKHWRDKEVERVKQRDRSLAAERANKTRLRNAIANGRCHLCGDEAHNLFIHLQNHHPQWLKDYGE